MHLYINMETVNKFGIVFQILNIAIAHAMNNMVKILNPELVKYEVYPIVV